ncbi:MAG: TonB-dependent receptor domain-containing protein [Acidobacteriota bacterium]
MHCDQIAQGPLPYGRGSVDGFYRGRYRSRDRQRAAIGVLLILIFCLTATQAQENGTMQGRVFDEQGGIIVGAQVVLIDENGVEKPAVTHELGGYSFAGLTPGLYILKVAATGFATYENFAQITGGSSEPASLDVTLKVALEQQEVTVMSEAPTLSLEAANNAGAIILQGEDLEALPEDPEELADVLLALAGPSAGPDGGQFYIDGFSGGRLPRRSSIREIRINRNPFSAEFDRVGFGRIEIFTKPGTDKFRGQLSFNFNDESLNSRNPFASNKPPFQTRHYGGTISGPLVSNRASFFLDFDRRSIEENAVINARVLDENLNILSFNQAVVTPNVRTSLSPRFDYQLNEQHTLIASYGYSRFHQENVGIGQFSLLSRAYDSAREQHELRLTETAIFSPNLINETRFQYEFSENNREGDNSLPTIRVLDAFTGGGSQVGLSFNELNRWELQNLTSWNRRAHAFKAGLQVRGVSLEDVSRSNFGGTFTFGGGLAPELDAHDQVLLSGGNPVLAPITSLERYRRTLLFQQREMTAQEIRALGGGATQFSINGGDPESGVSQYDFAGFLQDDWRVTPNLLLSLGVRYEIQNNINDNFDLAPRVGLAWAPGARRGFSPKTVIRAGAGIFYSRVDEELTLDADRFDGIKQAQFIVANPDFFPNVPSVEELLSGAQPQTTRRVSPDLNTPYSMQGAISVERQLPLNFTISASYIKVRTLHMLRSRNINAPLPGSGVRPLGEIGNVYEYQSDGRFDQNQLMVNFSNRFSSAFTIFGNYVRGSAKSDTDGAASFPADPYDLSSEWGRAGFDVRHRFVMGGSLSAPWGVRFNPFLIATSGRPFNITSGRDFNADSVFTERPAFATDLSKPGVVITPLGAFDPNPEPGQPMVPRNFGEGAGFLMVRLRLSKTVGFGKPLEAPGEAEEGGLGGHGPRIMGAGGGPPQRGSRGGGGFGRLGGGASDKPYSLTFSVDVNNLLNHTNLGPTIGNISSPLFGQANSALSGFGFRDGGGGAGNRRVELSLRFNF